MSAKSDSMTNQLVALESAPCPMGCPEADELMFLARDRIHNLPGEFCVVRCRSCGLLRTSPRPTADTIGFYYPDDYGPYVGTRVVKPKRERFRQVGAKLLKAARRVFDVRSHSIPAIKPGRMLEIGCASVSYLQEMASKGWVVEGIEFSPKAAASARSLGFSVETGAVETVEKPDAYYDLIVAWMVIEHLHEPVDSLRKIARWAKPGGMLALSVPDVGAAEFRLFGPRWYALHIPNHLFHFDRHTLTNLLEATGWRVTRITWQRTVANAIASAGYWAQDRGYRRTAQFMINFPESGGRIGALLLYPVALVMAAIGQTGRMTVWAERMPT